jgi:hypothetical protein
MKPTRNARYLAWIRTLPCVVCGVIRGIEASHTGPHGLGQKSPDSSAVPLCSLHHRTGKDSYHKLGPRAFCATHGLSLPSIVQQLNLKPAIRVESGRFVGYLEGRYWVLGKTQAGIEIAVKKMVRICTEDRAEQLREKVPA